MRAAFLGLSLCLGLAACGSVDEHADDLVTDPIVLPARADLDDESAKADAIRTYVIRSVTVPARAAATETRKVFTTVSSFKSFFGQGARVPVDFSKRWLAFYSAGTKPTGGYSVSIPLVTRSATGRTLEVNTRLDSPGEGCVVTQATTRPSVLVSFAKPSPAPGAVRYYKSDRKPAACVASGLCGDALRGELLGATSGLLWTSESDYPFTYFTRAGAGATPLDAARLLALLGLPAGTPVAERTLESALRWVTSDDFAAEDPRAAARYRALKALLERNLTEIKVWKVGTVQVGTHFFGKTSCGDLAGLSTISIET